MQPTSQIWEAGTEDTQGAWFGSQAATMFHLRLCEPLAGLSGHEPRCEENKRLVQISADIC